MRVAIGYILLRHGIVKAHMGATAVAANIMAKNGMQPALAFAYAATALETVGAVCIILGLFTRFFAAALAIEIGIAFLFVHLPKGFAAAQGGYEYVLLIGIGDAGHRASAAAAAIRSTAWSKAGIVKARGPGSRSSASARCRGRA